MTTSWPPARVPVILWTIVGTCWMVGYATAAVHSSIFEMPSVLSSSRNIMLDLPRGGSSVTEEAEEPAKKKGKKKKKKRKKKKPSPTASAASTKAEVSQAMREKDAATALGDAIRDRADILRSDLHLSRIDDSVSSVGWAMGASDYSTNAQQTDLAQEDGGGVEAAPTSVLANYFLKSHGGAHALQCVCSSLATMMAIGAIVLPRSSPLKLTCLKRSLQFAMTKHVSGLLAASTMAATAIPSVGLRQARVWMEKLALDPVSQYLFYAALLLMWMPSSATAAWWWQPPVGKYSPALMVGPILLREAISTAFVVSDVLVLLTTAADQGVSKLLQVGQSLTNMVMCLLVTPSKWKNSNAAQRQVILARLTSRICLLLELAMGLLLCVDGLLALWEQSFSSERPPLLSVIKRLVCARLYINYLMVRKRKITKLAGELRGGASQLPIRVLNVLLEPRASMGLSTSTNDDEDKDEHDTTWMEYAKTALGFEE